MTILLGSNTSKVENYIALKRW